MKINKICAIVFIVMMFLGLCVLSGCGDEATVEEPSTNSRLVITYFEEEEMLLRKSYTVDTFELLTLDEKIGYTFEGWFLDKELNNKFDLAKLNDYFKEGKINLYASWSIIRNNFVIETKGMVDDKAIINPTFVWNNPYGDKLFIVKLFKDQTLVKLETTSDTHFSSPILDYNTSYRFVLEGKDSKDKKEVSFTTIENNNYNTDKEVVLNDPFMDNMVIQRNEIIDLSGVGPEKALISVEFGDELYFGISDETGKFNVQIEAHEASFDPIKINVGLGLKGSASIENVLIGDVFFFSGQSNMQWPTSSSDSSAEDILKAQENDVRFFAQNVVESKTPMDHVTEGKWFSATPYNVPQYSAICLMTGSFLGEHLKNQNVPLGILSAYQGNTNIANWMSDEYYDGNCGTKHLHYNAMVHPLRHAKVKGVVWYQGCNNSAAGGDYKDILLSYFENYRDLFNDDDLPFYVIGLACYDGDSGNNYDFSYVRESQAMACELDENAYYISTCDDGDPTFIHPTSKKYIAERVCKSILSTQYEYTYLAEGPSYKSHTVNGNTVTIELNNASGLVSRGVIDDLYLAGEDGKYYLATARIVGETIVASSEKVANPVYIKYGFGKSPFTNIFNKDNFSMVPFRTDKYNANIDLLDYNNIDAYKFHPSGSKMNVSYVDSGLKIVKANDGLSFGSVQLDKWGMIAYNPTGFRFTVVGTNSGAKITFRAVEGPSYETWGFQFIDDFVGEKTFELTMDDFKAMLNSSDNIFNTQAISYIEIVIENSAGAEIIINEARFTSSEK